MLGIGIIGMLLVIGSFLFPGARFQQSDPGRKEFLRYQGKAENGDAHAQFKLGKCYALGHGVRKDEVEAMKWYRKAAVQNFAEAKYILARCYENGLGVAKDYVEAYAGMIWPPPRQEQRTVIIWRNKCCRNKSPTPKSARKNCGRKSKPSSSTAASEAQPHQPPSSIAAGWITPDCLIAIKAVISG